MTAGRFLTATVVGGIALFILGFLLWGLTLMGFLEAQSVAPDGLSKDPMNLVLIFFSNLFYAAFLTLAVGVWAGKRGFGAGFSGGMIVGLLGSVSYALIFLGTMNFMTVTGHVVDAVASAVWAGIGAGVICAFLARGDDAPAV